jgi:hypothetical protein
MGLASDSKSLSIMAVPDIALRVKNFLRFTDIISKVQN